LQLIGKIVLLSDFKKTRKTVLKSSFIYTGFLSCLLFLILNNHSAYAQATWSFDLNGGAAGNIPMSLTIKQQDYPDISLTAKYYTEPFTLPVYWDWRFSRWKNERGWEFESIHHKLYLKKHA